VTFDFTAPLLLGALFVNATFNKHMPSYFGAKTRYLV